MSEAKEAELADQVETCNSREALEQENARLRAKANALTDILMLFCDNSSPPYTGCRDEGEGLKRYWQVVHLACFAEDNREPEEEKTQLARDQTALST